MMILISKDPKALASLGYKRQQSVISTMQIRRQQR